MDRTSDPNAKQTAKPEPQTETDVPPRPTGAAMLVRETASNDNAETTPVSKPPPSPPRPTGDTMGVPFREGASIPGKK